MTTIANNFVKLVSLLQAGFLVLEMFLWDKPIGLWAFDMEQKHEFATASKSLAKNQGLYNGFLAAGLAWGLWGLSPGTQATSVKVFFLGCVLIAGLYGAATANSRKVTLGILVFQALPAAVALALVYLS